jgi:hypothetical protein
MTGIIAPKQSRHFVLPKGPASTSSLLSELWERSRDTMGQADLEWFSQAGEEANNLTINLRKVIMDAAGREDECCSDITSMLYFIEQSLATIGALSYIGREADYALRQEARGGHQ